MRYLEVARRVRASSVFGRPGRRLALLGGVTVVALMAGGIAWATIPAAGGLISGCYNKTTGALRVIDPSKGQACAGTEAALNWNAGIRWQGNWNPATAYAVNDAVASNGSSYVARAASTGSKPPNTNWNLLARMGATGAAGPAGPAGPQGPSGFSQIQHGSSIPGYPVNNTGTAFGWVVTPVTTTLTSSTEAAITSSAEWDSTDGYPATTIFAVCYAPSGSTNLTPITDLLASRTTGYDPVTLSAALIPSGTWDVGLCSELGTSNGGWYAGSTTVVTGNYVPPGFSSAAKVQPAVQHSARLPRQRH
jgi:hypothetical protein